MKIRKILAWGVHLYTALGLVAAAGIAVLLVRGDAAAFRLAFVVMFAATAIDATDGWLARKAEVKKYAPEFDGRRLDDLTDFHNYTTLPLLLIWRAGILEQQHQWWLILPLLASAYGFSQAQAKTDDNYFLGFPSYWNIVAFYLYLLRPSSGIALLVLVSLALLTFVPSRYLYTTRGGRFSLITNISGIVWAGLLLVILWQIPDAAAWLVLLSLVFPAYYMVLSWLISIRDWQRRERPEESLAYQLSPRQVASEDEV